MTAQNENCSTTEKNQTTVYMTIRIIYESQSQELRYLAFTDQTVVWLKHSSFFSRTTFSFVEIVVWLWWRLMCLVLVKSTSIPIPIATAMPTAVDK